CFRCEQLEHCIDTCPEVLNMLNKGIIKCNTEGRLTMSNSAKYQDKEMKL
ncbi:hypothetical protein OBBRIDRAFT_726780, partial [Obba rivulosa]